jgi:hypothetical protein
MVTACRIVVVVFALLVAAALGLFVVGTWGLFGVEPDPLAGVFLNPLGWPWNRGLAVLPEALWLWGAAAAPVLNLLILWALCRGLAAWRRG